jgi:DNA modification methylase
MPFKGEVRVGAARLVPGDCFDVLPALAEASCDALVTDPPAGIGFMGKEWDRFGGRANRNAENDRVSANASLAASGTRKEQGRGTQPFGYSDSAVSNPGQRAAFVAFLSAALRECLRVLKPGAYGLVWALPRTSHWTATACEDAGFEVRDRIAHLFGTGFPKGKGCLKPAVEDWWLVRKPGPRVLPLGIEECRVGADAGWSYPNGRGGSEPHHMQRGERNGLADVPCRATAGRWPANVVLSHAEGCRPAGTRRVKVAYSQPTRGEGGAVYDTDASFRGDGRPVGYAGPDGTEEVEVWECVPGCPLAALDAQAGERKGRGNRGPSTVDGATGGYSGGWPDHECGERFNYDAGGSVNRFFYCPKASKADRGAGNGHPTVKNTALMEWLVKLVCPPGGVVLDPFAGSGSTGVAALRCGRGFVGVEREPEYFATARRRVGEAAAVGRRD